MNQKQHLDNRSLLRVGGEDAETFLQNIFTNDLRHVQDGLQYNLLLTPQGMILHDVFVFRRDGAFFIDVETPQLADLTKRLTMFRLRAKVELSAASLKTYSCVSAEGGGYADPRDSKLGFRFYTDEMLPADVATVYEDQMIALGIPNGLKTIRYGKDFSHEINLDHLNAISWTKGCFIGQEVAARVYNRGLAKKRLVILSGSDLKAEGDVRQVNSTGTQGLAVLRLDDLPQNAVKPAYLNT